MPSLQGPFSHPKSIITISCCLKQIINHFIFFVQLILHMQLRTMLYNTFLAQLNLRLLLCLLYKMSAAYSEFSSQLRFYLDEVCHGKTGKHDYQQAWQMSTHLLNGCHFCSHSKRQNHRAQLQQVRPPLEQLLNLFVFCFFFVYSLFKHLALFNTPPLKFGIISIDPRLKKG